MNICPNCRKPVPEDSAFCPACGAALPKETAPAPQTSGKLLYSARRSIWRCKGRLTGGILLFLLGILGAVGIFASGDVENDAAAGIFSLAIALVGVLLIVIAWLVARSYRLDVYDDQIVVREGLVNVREDRSLLTPVVGASVSQGLWGRLFDYGDVKIDKVGKGWDVATDHIKHPAEFKRFLESLIRGADRAGIANVMIN